MTRSAHVVVDLGAVAANARAVKRLCPGSSLIAVVKRDAYGHGSLQVGRALRGIAAMLAVADPEEARALRSSGITAPILVLGCVGRDQRGALARAGILSTVASDRDIAGLAPAKDGTLLAQLKFDTGMGRLGFEAGRASEVARMLGRRGVRRLAGTWTHLAAGHEAAFTAGQLRRFDDCLAALRRAGIEPGLTHAANSAGILADARSRSYGAVRPGLLLYGCTPGGLAAPRWLRPAMSFRTQVAAVRRVSRGCPVSYDHTWRSPAPATLAVLPAGYADGFGRLQSGRGEVLIRGRRAPVRGIVCMNLTVVEVTRIPGVRPGDEAVFFGSQGRARLPVDLVAQRQRTISYEVLCAAGGLNCRRWRSGRG